METRNHSSSVDSLLRCPVKSKKNIGKFRRPVRRWVVSSPAVVRSRDTGVDAESDDVVEGNRTTSILCNLRRSYASRGISTAPTGTPKTPSPASTSDGKEGFFHESRCCVDLKLSDEAPLTPDGPLDVSLSVIPANDKTTAASANAPKDARLTPCFSITTARRTISPLKVGRPSVGVHSSDDDDDDSDCVLDDNDDEGSTSSHDGNSSSCGSSCINDGDDATRKRHRPRIRFQSYVKVVEIPGRFSYTFKQRRRMWNNHKAIRSNAKRNRIEYEWEGRPYYQDAIEDDQYCDDGNGQKVHPAHIVANATAATTFDTASY